MFLTCTRHGAERRCLKIQSKSKGWGLLKRKGKPLANSVDSLRLENVSRRGSIDPATLSSKDCNFGSYRLLGRLEFAPLSDAANFLRPVSSSCTRLLPATNHCARTKPWLRLALLQFLFFLHRCQLRRIHGLCTTRRSGGGRGYSR